MPSLPDDRPQHNELAPDLVEAGRRARLPYTPPRLIFASAGDAQKLPHTNDLAYSGTLHGPS